MHAVGLAKLCGGCAGMASIMAPGMHPAEAADLYTGSHFTLFFS